MSTAQFAKLPLFDRLAPTNGGGETLDHVLASIRAEIEALLNTRLPIPIDRLNDQSRTITSYGIPDLPYFSGLSFGSWNELCRHLADTIMAFEPRLTGVEVKVRQADNRRGRLELAITADLRNRPDAGPVAFYIDVMAGRA